MDLYLKILWFFIFAIVVWVSPSIIGLLFLKEKE